MKCTTIIGAIENCRTDCLVLFCNEAAFERNIFLKRWDNMIGGGIKEMFDTGEFGGRLNESAVVHCVQNENIKRTILVGLGKPAGVFHDSYRQAAGAVSKLTAAKKSKNLAVCLENAAQAEFAQAIVEGIMLGGFVINDYRTGDVDYSFPEEIIFFCNTKAVANKAARLAEWGRIISEQAIFTRRLAATPSNDLTPRKFVATVQKEAKKYGVSSRALDEKQIVAERMLAFDSVARGSAEPPRLLILEYSGGAKTNRPIVLLGKGITFDAGGISLKPALDMHHMKSDMSGGAAVAGAVIAAARLGLRQNVVGLVPLAENLPSGTATRPGDIVKSRKGKTIEILNTDAEGRLILADGLDYANEFNPQAVIDICTLTGGAMYVLGYGGALLMGNNDKLKAQVKDASDATAERTWELPLWDEYGVWMKSDIADLKNSGGKPGTSLTAAAFLQEFTGDWPWAHIDIASVDYMPALEQGKFTRSYIPSKTYTGFGMRLLVEVLSKWKKVGR